MATLEADGQDLVVRMSKLEELEAVHHDVRVPLDAVTDVRPVDDPFGSLRGLRAPGTSLPGLMMVGTLRGEFGKDFAVIHGRRPAVVVDLDGAEYQRLIVTVPDAPDVAEAMERTRRA